MAILITGGAGFIGSHLIDWLLENTSDPIVCLDNLSGCRGAQNIAGLTGHPRFVLVEADVCDPTALASVFARWPIQRVVHMAAIAGVRDSRLRPHLYQTTNIGGTVALLEACKACGLRRLVFVSSSTVYGTGVPVPFAEDQPLGVPTSPYGVSKRAAELMVLNYHQLHGVPAVIVRPFSVYGSRMRSDLALSIFADQMQRGEPVTMYGDGSSCRDYTHVSDTCAGIVAALWSDDLEGEAINLGAGSPLRLDQAIAQLEHALDCTARIKTGPVCQGELPVTHASLTKAWNLLGYKPKVPFEEGIVEYASWYRQGRYPRLAEVTRGAARPTPQDAGPVYNVAFK